MTAKPRRIAKTNKVTGMYEPYEEELCIAFYYKYLILKGYNQLKNIEILHIPNERKTSKHYGARLKRMGVVSGAADYLVSIRGGRHAFIEFKRTSKDKLQPNQKLFEAKMLELGVEYHLVYDVDKGMELLNRLDIIG